MTISVCLVEDHEIIRLGLEEGINRDNELRHVKSFTSVEEALTGLENLEADVCLIDVRLPTRDGLYALEQIRSLKPNQRVVMISVYDNPTYIARAIALGAKDFVKKSASLVEILDSIRRVGNDLEAPSNSVTHRIRTALSQKSPVSSDNPLTNRELQVVRHLAFGLSNKEIAFSLKISIETVKEHVQNILRKINANDRTQAAVWAVRGGLVNGLPT